MSATITACENFRGITRAGCPECSGRCFDPRQGDPYAVRCRDRGQPVHRHTLLWWLGFLPNPPPLGQWITTSRAKAPRAFHLGKSRDFKNGGRTTPRTVLPCQSRFVNDKGRLLQPSFQQCDWPENVFFFSHDRKECVCQRVTSSEATPNTIFSNASGPSLRND